MERNWTNSYANPNDLQELLAQRKLYSVFETYGMAGSLRLLAETACVGCGNEDGCDECPVPPISERIKIESIEQFKAQKRYEKHLQDTDDEKLKRLEALRLWLELTKEDDSDDQDVTIED